MKKKFIPSGVIPACLLPFSEDFSIDERSYRKHLRDVCAVKGLSAITVNGHASEVSSCTFEEQQRVLDITLDEVGDRIPVIAGVFADGSIEAARIAREAEKAGASALLVFPPVVFQRGVQQRPGMPLIHYKYIAEASELPLVIFQYAVSSGFGYTLDTISKLVEEVPSIASIKEASGDPVFHETLIRTLRAAPRKIQVLTTHSAWPMSSLVLGCDGFLSGSGSTIADLQVEIWEAFQRKDLTAAEAVAERIYHWSKVIYCAPALDMHNRMKVAQVLLGRLPNAVVRPPLLPLADAEISRIAAGLEAAGLKARVREAAE